MRATFRPKTLAGEPVIKACRENRTELEPDLPRATCAETDLIRASLAGDHAAYGRLYDQYAGLVRAVCHDSTHDLHEAQDLCQEVFLRAFRNLGELREHERFSAWLLGIARMVCRESRRKAARERKRRQAMEGGSIATQPAEPEDGGEIALLLAEIAKLPERERLALHLFYLQEQPVLHAQRIMGLSRSGFYRVLDRARDRLKRALDGKRIT